MFLDVVELTRRAVELASKDEEFREKIKDKIVSIALILKNDPDISMTIFVKKGDIEISNTATENPDFQFEASKEDFTKLVTGKTPAMLMLATKKLKLTKGSMGEIGKIASPFLTVLKYGKEVAKKEGMV
jgi:putative sterol carrier protein